MQASHTGVRDAPQAASGVNGVRAIPEKRKKPSWQVQSLVQGDMAAAPEAAECIEVDSGGATESGAISQGRRAQGEL